jgi:hypothetical protein
VNLGTEITNLSRQTAEQTWRAPLAQCHGLAGNGEFLLDLAQLTGEEHHLDTATEVAGAVYSHRAYRHGGGDRLRLCRRAMKERWIGHRCLRCRKGGAVLVRSGGCRRARQLGVAAPVGGRGRR